MMKKERVFTFKADDELADLLKRVPNRSEFIRNAIETALANKCPLCYGKGFLTDEQTKHLQKFMDQHPLEKCEECNAIHFICRTDDCDHSPK